MNNPPRGERVQKLIARSGLASRRKAEEWIREGRVTVNGTVCKLGDRVVPDEDWLKVDGRTVTRPQQNRYLLLNKPAGYLASVTDPEGRRTVLELVPRPMRRALFPVGRLDYQTEGLLLLTTDGDWANKIAHPRYGCVKTYQVKVRGVPSEASLERLRRGVVLDGRRTKGCRIGTTRVQGRRSSSKNSWWTVLLEEGRNRQIRRMFQQVGHPVMRIRRVGIGGLTGKGLPVGACRELEADEVEALRRASGRAANPLMGPSKSRRSGTPQEGEKGKRKRSTKKKPQKTAGKKRTAKKAAAKRRSPSDRRKEDAGKGKGSSGGKRTSRTRGRGPKKGGRPR